MVLKEIGRFEKSEAVSVVISIDEFRGEKGVDIREYVKTSKYNGPTKKGTRIPISKWEEFKKKYGIKLLKKATPPARNKTHVFMSKDCVTIVTGSHSNENGNKYLGYMRFEAPLSHEEDLHKMLEDFSHITTFVKEEGSYAYPPKSYAGFI
ncbi:hypothetical protein LCGC14_2444410 [marine sediment metagenome]|uniref:Transcriptional coactivator p15 (PC4) C-terminal domain-containing protein n=1 Tax=marine sediment metagenome TaxID=412755 RepID=A0A0F9BI74_9ZZZZ